MTDSSYGTSGIAGRGVRSAVTRFLRSLFFPVPQSGALTVHPLRRFGGFFGGGGLRWVGDAVRRCHSMRPLPARTVPEEAAGAAKRMRARTPAVRVSAEPAAIVRRGNVHRLAVFGD